MQKIFQVDLDIKNPQLKSVPPIEVVSGDTDTNIFNINLLENFKEVNATGNTAVITFVKSDNTTVFQNLTVVNASKGQYTCTLSSQTIAAPGRVKAEVSLYEGTKRLTSVRFEFNVRKALLDDDTVESSNEFSALTEALADVEEMKDEVLNNLNTVSLSLSTVDSIKSISANVGSVPKVRIVAPDMLNNILIDGDCEDLTKWTKNGVYIVEDTTVKKFGNKSFKSLASDSAPAYAYKDITDSGLNYYFISSYAYVSVNDSGSFGVLAYDKGSFINNINALADKTKLNTWQRLGNKIAKTDGLRLLIGRSGSGLCEGNIDGVNIYKITAEEYNNLTVDQLLAKYPYVNGIQPLLNPCLRVRGKNLLPSDIWELGQLSLSDGSLVSSTARSRTKRFIACKANQAYTATIINNFAASRNFVAMFYDKSYGFLGFVNKSLDKNVTTFAFTTLSKTAYVKLYFSSDGSTPDLILQAQLEEGTTATAYEPSWEKQRIYPCLLGKVGNYADELEDDGVEVRKTWRVKRVPVEVTVFGTSVNVNYATMPKPANCVPFIAAVQPEILVPTKTQYPDTSLSGLPADSPYIGNYLTTSGSGGLIFFIFSKAITTLEQAKAELAGLELWYALATPEQEIIEPVGSLKLEQGYNCIDVSSGIVYEKANPVVSGSYMWVNIASLSDSILEYKTKNILSMLKNGVEDIQSWTLAYTDAYGNVRIGIPIANGFDPTAIYTIKYEVLQEGYNSQQVQVMMEYADNLRTSHNQLVENVAGLESEVNDVWFALLPIADKEIAMQRIALLTTETTADLKAKVNEILNVWR